MEQEMETRLYRHEGTLLFSTEVEAPTPVIAAIVVAAVPGDAPGEMGLRWRVHGDPVHGVPIMAKFLQLNPAFSMAVQGVMQMMLTGRLDGGMLPPGGACPHHQPPPDEPPEG